MNTFRKIAVVILMHLMAGYGIAQTCSYSKDEVDKFTKNRTLYTKPINVITNKVKLDKVYKIEKIEMQTKFENNRYTLNVAYHFALGLTVANTKDILILLLANGVKVELPCLQDIPSQIHKRNGVAIFSYEFEISETNLKILMESNITDVRITAQINPIDFSIGENIKTNTLFSCIMQNK